MPAALPMPPELAVDRPPLTDTELDQVADEILAHADESGLTPGEILASFLNGDGTVAIGPEPARRFRVTDLGSAEWAMRQVADAALQEGELAAQRDAWMERIGGWFVQASRSLVARQAFFNAHLEAYALAERARDDKRKTLTVPSGKVRTTAKQPKVVVTDEAAVITWARANLVPEAEIDADYEMAATLEQVVKVTESVLLTGLREVAEIQPVQIATRWTAVLACGHTWVTVTDTRPVPTTLDGDQDPMPPAEPWARGDLLACADPACADRPELSAVDTVTGEPVNVLVSSVPGTAVEEEATTAKVTPGA